MPITLPGPAILRECKWQAETTTLTWTAFCCLRAQLIRNQGAGAGSADFGAGFCARVDVEQEQIFAAGAG